MACLVFAHALQHLGASRFSRSLHHITAGRLASAAPDGLAAHGDGFTFFTGLRTKTINDLDFNVLLGEALNVLHEAFFIQTHQIHCCTIGTRAACAANAMHIVFADIGNFVVHHVRQVVNVDTARSNVGCYQSAHIAALEAGKRLGTRGLALVAVQCHGSDAVLFQKLRHVVGAELGTGEYQHLAPVVFLDDVGQQGFFLAASHGVDHLGNALHGGVAGGDLHALRVLEQAIGQVTNFVTEGGREQQALLVFGHQGQHFFHVMDEAHVQHAVGFVQHQHLHLAEVEHALLCQIQQSAGCGHQNIHALFELGDLWVHAHTTKNHGGAELQVFSVGANRFFHLGGEFAGGGQHQGTDAGAAKFVLRAAAHGQAVQQGQGKSGRLAGAGLGAAEQVVALHDQGDRLCLNGGGGFVTFLAHGLENGRGQVQFFEVHF